MPDGAALTPWEGTRLIRDSLQPDEPIGPHCMSRIFFKTFYFVLVEFARGEINNVGLGEPGKDLFDKGNVHWVLFDIVLTVLGGGKFNDKGVSDSVLAIMLVFQTFAFPFLRVLNEGERSVWPTSRGGRLLPWARARLQRQSDSAPTFQRTCMPSMLLSVPPDERMMYGFCVVACRHLSLRPSISALSCFGFVCQLLGTCTVGDFVAHLVALGLVDLGLELEQDNMRNGSHFERVEQGKNLCR